MAFTTYERIAEQIERRLGKITDDSDILRPELILAIRQRLGRKVLERFYQTKSDDVGQIDGGFIYTFKNIPVLEDVDLDSYYAVLPSSYPDILYGLGLKQVSPSKEPKTVYIPVKNGFNGLFNGLEGATLEGQIGYYVENDRVYFENMTASNNPPYVLMKITCPLDGLAPNTQVNIPSDLQADVIEEVVAMYLPKPPTDNSNNQQDAV